LVFQGGTYRISKHLVVGVSGVTLYSSGATIHATSATDGALMIQGDNVAVYGFTLTQDSNMRLSTPWGGGISVYDDRGGGRRRVQGTVIQNNIVNNSAAAGIFLYKASNFTVAGNRVYRSWADGIHMTAGSSDGRVIHNTVLQTGDDMIAVVSYAGTRGTAPVAVRYKNWASQQDELDQDIYVGSNEVADQYWGRGISVVGGSNVTIENNAISKTPTGAGVYLTRETSYMTFGDHNIMVSNNAISQVQTNPPTYMPPGFNPVLTHQGAIELGAQMANDEVSNPVYVSAFSLEDISIIGNQVQDARFAGIRIGIYSPSNTNRQVIIKNNNMTKVGSSSIIEQYPGLTAATASCSGNTLDGVNWPSQCAKSIPTVTPNYLITGASLKCDESGQISTSLTSRPEPPTDLRAY
jgi:parallel beta-helix repeat protein